MPVPDIGIKGEQPALCSCSGAAGLAAAGCGAGCPTAPLHCVVRKLVNVAVRLED
jgi:hypothetical protein